MSYVARSDRPALKADRYEELEGEILAVLDGEPDRIARMATAASMLADAFESYFWTGFYIVDPARRDELVVGPYQGTLGCLRIAFGRGVCGTAAATGRTQVVEDVHAFPGHIACDSRSASEIVVPVFDASGSLIAVFDVDSTEPAAFDAVDAEALERLMRRLFAGLKDRDMQIGVDFGGTKIEAAALAADGRFLERRRVANPGAYDAALVAVKDLVQAVETATGQQGSVGVGAPGSPSPRTGRMRNANAVWLNGRAFAADLETVLGRPVRLANDANCLALSEAADGAAAGARTAFAIIIGTGCGGGLAVDGRLVEGAHGVAGEWGHVSLPWPDAAEAPGPACWCGLRGCLETWVSGTGFQRDHAAVTGRTWTAEAVIAAARSGDPGAAASLDRYVDRLGRAMAMVVNLVDPDAFVLGGGLSNVDELYERLPAVVARHAFSDVWAGSIAPARWGDSSGVRGAARLWPVAGAAGTP